MFSSKSCFVHVILPVAVYFGSQYYGMTKANVTQVISTTAIKISLLTVEIKPSTKIAALRDNSATETVAVIFETETIYSKSKLSTVQETILKLPSVSVDVGKQPWTTKQSSTFLAENALPSISRVHSVVPHATKSINFVQGQPSPAVVSFSPSQTNSLQFNSTGNPPTHKEVGNGDCSSGKIVKTEFCDNYVTRWVDFYLNVSILLIGLYGVNH